MPRKPRNSPNPPGRPSKAKQAAAAVTAVERGELGTEDAAAAAGVGKSTLKRHRAATAGKAPIAPPRPGGGQPAQPAPAADRRAALLAALADALAADPALVEGLPLDPSELGRRLAEPGLLAEGDLDPLAILRRVQARLERDMATLPPASVVARKGVAAALVQLAKGAEAIMADRPPIGETPEQVAERRIRERRDQALAKIFEHVETGETKAA